MAVTPNDPPISDTFLTGGTPAPTNIREDLADEIFRIDPAETPLVSNLGSDDAQSTMTEWLVQELKAADKNAQPEGFRYIAHAPLPPDRKNNICQIMTRNITVSGTLRSVNTVGGDEYDRQMILKGLEVRRDLEWALTRPTPKKDTDPRELAGLPIWCTNGSVGATGVMPPGDGTVGTFAAGTGRDLSLELIAAAKQDAFEDGGNPDLGIISPRLKRVFSALASGPSGIAMDNVLQATAPRAATLVGAVDVYLTDFGPVEMAPDRFAPDDQLLIVDTDFAERAPLPGRNMVAERMAKAGDADDGFVLWEGTLRVMAPKAHACIFALN